MKLKLKICGLKYSDNIAGVAGLKPDYMGFIFYGKSPRYMGELEAAVLEAVPDSIMKVGVFVNEQEEQILQMVSEYGLDAVQLHGDESVETAISLKQTGLTVIKVFRVMDQMPQDVKRFDGKVDYFLFDTRSKEYGGTGHQFDWSILEEYDLATPYLLSGGISLEDIAGIREKAFPGMIGIDVNSKFETAPGVKHLERLKELKEQL